MSLFHSRAYTRVVFFFVGNAKGLLFRLGMLLIRASNWGLSLSSNHGWQIDHPLRGGATGIASVEARYTMLRAVVSEALEPPRRDGQECVLPRESYELLQQFLMNVWWGGATKHVLALLDEVIAEYKADIE